MGINIQQIISYDKELLLALNGSHSAFWDGFMWVYTSTVIWIPLAMILLYVIIKNNKLKEALLIFVSIAILIFLCDRISSGFFKSFFKRLRPTQDPEIMYLVDIVNGYRGGRYGFISSHAANAFGIFTFTALLFRRKSYTAVFFFWAILTAFTRIYLGVHYPGDILAGSLLGCILGSIIYFGYKLIRKRIFVLRRTLKYGNINSNLNDYPLSDIYLLIATFLSTILFIMIIGLYFVEYVF